MPRTQATKGGRARGTKKECSVCCAHSQSNFELLSRKRTNLKTAEMAAQEAVRKDVKATLEEIHLSEENLLKDDIKSLNKRIKEHLNSDENKTLKQRRRTMKNRGYAQNARANRRKRIKQLEQRLKKAMMEIADFKAQLWKVRQETTLLKAYLEDGLNEHEKRMVEEHIDRVAALEPQNDLSKMVLFELPDIPHNN